MHRRTFTAEDMFEMDRLFCILHSLGTIITQVCNLETEEPDIPSLADLGRLVREKADFGLEQIQEPTKAKEMQGAI